jgi:hypothetical protein
MTEDQNALAREILASACEISVATNRSDGWPHVSVVGFVSDGLVLYFGCAAGSQQALNLARDARVSITATGPPTSSCKPQSLSLAGDACFVTECGELGRVIELMIARYGADLASNGVIDLAQTHLVRVDPKAISLLDCAIANGNRSDFDIAPRKVQSRAA